MTTMEEIRKYAEASLSSARFKHVEGVALSIAELSSIYGEDGNAAKTAAYLHDIAREWDKDRLHEIAETAHIDKAFYGVKELMHGPVAAWLGQTKFGITDTKILNAVYYHTTGRPSMSLLDKLLFVADAIEPSRSYPGVEKIRSLVSDSLNGAVLASIDSTITYLVRIQKPIAVLTIEARNALLQELPMTRSKRQEM